MLSANIDNITRKAVYRRDGYTCVACGSTRYLQVHHMLTRSLGGKNDLPNLVTLCAHCHALAHGDRFPDDPPYMDELWVIEAAADYLADMYPP